MKGFNSKFYRTDNDSRSSISFSFNRKSSFQIENWTKQEKESALEYLKEQEKKFQSFKNELERLLTALNKTTNE